MMRTTHNNLNAVIEKMDRVIDKGQPWAKKNKERVIRCFIREMKKEQRKPITLREVWFYFWMWLKSKFRSSNKEQEVHCGEQNR